MRPFSSTSVWNTDVRGLPLDPRSVAVSSYLASLPGKNINYNAYTNPIYRVPANQPTVPIQIVKTGQVFNVPIPPGALPSAGLDKQLAIIRGVECWDLGAYNPETKRAGYGGHIPDITAHSGVYPPSPKEGATAPGFALLGGLITLEDAAAGKIDHALAFAVPSLKGWLAKPANRTDGHNENPCAPPEGSHFRLDPALDLSTLGLPTFTRWMAEAVQKFGMIVRDYSVAVPFVCEDATHLGAPNPWTKPGGYFGGRSAYGLAQAFPWSHLQLLKMELVKFP